MQKLFPFFFRNPTYLIIILFSIISCSKIEKQEKKSPVVKLEYDKFGILADSFNVLKGTIRKNETLAEILTKADIDYNLITKIYNKSKPVFDFKKIRPNNNYSIYSLRDSLNSFYAFAYDINDKNYIIIKNLDSLYIDIIQRDVEIKERFISGTIDNSLYQTLVELNASIVLSGELAEVFAWQIDFYTIQKGDRFYVMYEELFVSGNKAGIGNIIAAKFIHKNNPFYAFLFKQNGRYEYFDEDGSSLQKEFLKAPLKYRRISSGYSGRRLHPILRVYTPHKGIDYAAAVGTPVQSVGDGIVLQVGRNGPAGRMIKIRHNSVYSSAYLHLSGYAKGIRKGVKVKQAQLIGYVGSSGRSTGPHLDFRFWKNGSLVNYLTQKFPASKAVADSNRLVYNSLKDSLLQRIEGYINSNQILLN